MNDEAAGRLAIDAAFAVLPWPRGQGGHQRMLRRFIRSARMRYYRVAPLSLLSRQQPCLLDLGHPQQARLLDSRRPVIYRAPDLCLPASVQPDAVAQGDHARIRDALMRADFILYQSRLSKQRMDALHLPAEGRWAIVPNGVCLNYFSPDPIGRQRQAGQPPVLGVVGPGCHHAWLTLLLAMSRRLTVRPHLLLVGRFDLDCQRVLDQALLDPFWQKVIEYVPRLSEPEWVSYYRRMDCLLHPATGEAAPHEVIEALACGVPVLSPETAGSVEWIGNGGMVVPNPEPDEPWGEGLQAAVAAGVERLLEDLPALRRQARLQAEKENNIEIMTPLYLRGMGLPPGGPSRGWKYTAVRSIGQLYYYSARLDMSA